MMRLRITIVLLIGLNHLSGQTFINGDFENNICTGCDYNNTDKDFNTKISNVYAFGKALANYTELIGEVDIQTSGCYVTPHNGKWCLGLSSDTAKTSDAIALELTSNLIQGRTYHISCYVLGNGYGGMAVVDLKIGISGNDSTFGNLLFTTTPLKNTWKQIVFNFVATQNARFITVTNSSGINGWNQIDNFTIGDVTGIHDIKPVDLKIFPNPFNSYTTFQTAEQLQDATLILYNSVSQQVKKIENISGPFTLYRDGLSEGLYYFCLIEKNRQVSKGKLTITN